MKANEFKTETGEVIEKIGKHKSAIEILTEKIMEKQDGIMAILPSHTNPERFIKSALLVLSGSQKLQKCTVPSVVKCIYQAAELGLDFTPTKKLAYMVPFNNKGEDGIKRLEAVFMPGYKGLEQLAVNAKAASKFSTQLVYEKENFTLQQGTNPSITHIPLLTGERGNIIGAYTISWQNDGSFQFTFMRKDEIAKIRRRSKSPDEGPWMTDEGEMTKKTVIRRHTKSLQLSPDKESELFAKAIEADNQAVGLRSDEIVKDGRTQTERLKDLICDADYEDVPEVETPVEQSNTQEIKTTVSNSEYPITAAVETPAPEPVTPEPTKRGRPKKEQDGLFNSDYPVSYQVNPPIGLPDIIKE